MTEPIFCRTCGAHAGQYQPPDRLTIRPRCSCDREPLLPSDPYSISCDLAWSYTTEARIAGEIALLTENKQYAYREVLTDQLRVHDGAPSAARFACTHRIDTWSRHIVGLRRRIAAQYDLLARIRACT